MSTKYNFLFVHIPKTGGNSIQNILSQYSDDKIVCLSKNHDGLERFEVQSGIYKTFKHATLSDYRREYGDEMFEHLFKFCCVRNPWDRVVSHYFSPYRGKVHWEKDQFLQFIHSPEVKPLSHFLATDNASENDLKSGVRNMSFILRYENIQDDFNTVCGMLGLPPSQLPHRNKSVRNESPKHFFDRARRLFGLPLSKHPHQNVSVRDEYIKYYDAESVAAVAEKFNDEILYFGYSFPETQ